jgi:CelD/BcsL family acetyltransferase involved in cellulose biosynthesis
LLAEVDGGETFPAQASPVLQPSGKPEMDLNALRPRAAQLAPILVQPGLQARPAALEVHVRTISTQAGFSVIAADWERLHAEARVASVFNSWMWQYAWADIYGFGQSLRILVASRGNAVVGILPLYIQTVAMPGLPVRRLRVLGSGGDTNPDDLGPFFATGCETAAAALAHAVLTMPGVDVIELTDIDSRSPLPLAMMLEAERMQAECVLARSARIAYIELPKDWNTYLTSVSRHRRGHILSTRRKLAQAHPTRFFVWQDAANLNRAVDRLAELHRKRWGAASESFASEEYLALHRAAMKECFERDWLRLYCLEIGGEIAAISYCYRFRKHIFVMQAGFDPAYAPFSPGSVLLGYALEHAIGEGNTVFDFLRGEHTYKQLLATGCRETVSVTACRPTLGAVAYRANRSYLAKATAKARQLVNALQS